MSLCSGSQVASATQVNSSLAQFVKYQWVNAVSLLPVDSARMLLMPHVTLLHSLIHGCATDICSPVSLSPRTTLNTSSWLVLMLSGRHQYSCPGKLAFACTVLSSSVRVCMWVCMWVFVQTLQHRPWEVMQVKIHLYKSEQGYVLLVPMHKQHETYITVTGQCRLSTMPPFLTLEGLASQPTGFKWPVSS